jgi:hypothetical protein
MNKILCYDIFGPEFELSFSFPNLEEINTTDADMYRINCLSYREELGDDAENARNSLHENLSELGYKTMEELKNEKIECEKMLKRNTFKYCINPFGKKEDNFDRIMPLFYSMPLLGSLISIAVNSPDLLFLSISSTMVPVITEELRRQDKSEYKSKIEEIEGKLKNPREIFFSDLLNRTSEIDVDIIPVRNAEKLVKKIRDPIVFPTVNFYEVNQKLIEIYKNTFKKGKES